MKITLIFTIILFIFSAAEFFIGFYTMNGWALGIGFIFFVAGFVGIGVRKLIQLITR